MRLLLLIILLLGPAAETFAVEASEGAYGQARDAYYRLIESSRKKLYRDNWGKVIARFSAVYRKYPDSRRGVDAAYMVGKSRQQLYEISRLRGDAERAVESYDTMASGYPASSLADDALLAAGKLLEHPLLKPSEAYLRYQRVVTGHPKGDMVAAARKAVARLARFAPQAKQQRAKDRPVNGRAELEAIRFWSNPGYTRVVLDLSSAVKYKANFLKQTTEAGEPPRLYVDFNGALLGDDITEATTVNDGLLRRIRTGRPDAETVRVVIDLDSFRKYQVFALEEPFRVVIDVQGQLKAELRSNAQPSVASPVPTHKEPDSTSSDTIAALLKETKTPAKIKPAPPVKVPLPQRVPVLRRIVVDAGHGGKDPGAIGPNKIKEKHVVLSFAKKLAKRLEAELGCEVILTRDRDVYLRLEERTAIANQVNADLFVSIHANANRNRKVHGVETYYLNFSKNDKAAAVAARENGTSLKQVGDLEQILFDLMANAKLNESSRLANDIQSALTRKLKQHYSPLRDLGVRQGPFYVLLGATMPSVLVEIGFISNYRGEKRLTDKTYHARAIDGIVNGVRKYAGSYKVIAAK